MFIVITFLAYYYVFNIGIVSISVATSVCVLNLHFRGHKYSPVPTWIKKILFIETLEDIGVNLIRCKNMKKSVSNLGKEPSIRSLKQLEKYYRFNKEDKDILILKASDTNGDLTNGIH